VRVSDEGEIRVGSLAHALRKERADARRVDSDIELNRWPIGHATRRGQVAAADPSLELLNFQPVVRQGQDAISILQAQRQIVAGKRGIYDFDLALHVRIGPPSTTVDVELDLTGTGDIGI